MIKKYVLVLFILIFGYMWAYANEFSDTIFPWVVESGLTKYTKTSDFRGDDTITRAEATKFLSVFAEKIGLEKGSQECIFEDTQDYDPVLEATIISSCQYGLFRGDKGFFRPDDSITEAQALAVVVRSLYGMLDERRNPWYSAYFQKGQENAILAAETLESLIDTPITREKLATWLYRAYKSDALEDTIAYETDVDGPNDCSSFEKYDATKKTCSYECINEAECKTIQDQIDAELAKWSTSLEGVERDAPKIASTPAKGMLAIYDVDPSENITLKSGTDTPEYQSLWKEVAELAPNSLSEKYIETFEIYADAASDVIAFVIDDDGNGKWKVSINLPIHTGSSPEEQKATLVHELTHILTLNQGEFITPNGACPNYETDEGCTKASAYMNQFATKYWKNTKTATYTPESFITEYAATSPEEDIAESFSFFVLKPQANGTSIRDQKLNFFYNYPELVAIRNDMRSVLSSSIIRAKKASK